MAQRLILILLFLTSLNTNAQIPNRPEPERLVNDFANVLKPDEINLLERALVAFNDSTSIQIVVVTVSDLAGYDKSQFATELGIKWGVGQKGKNNGIVVLVKPRVGNSKGGAFIATGYGLEGVIPDAVARRIVANEMIPQFKEGNYAGGIAAGVSTLISLTKGEYTADQYTKKAKQKGKIHWGVFVFIAIILLIIIAKAQKNSNRHYSMDGAGSSLPFWMLLTMMNSRSGGGSGSSWSDFSSGGGDFGGFGGGDFGGGGAGGDW
jgi:uncharacterized protein